jgi:flagellar basal body-associated protein FliL
MIPIIIVLIVLLVSGYAAYTYYESSKSVVEVVSTTPTPLITLTSSTTSTNDEQTIYNDLTNLDDYVEGTLSSTAIKTNDIIANYDPINDTVLDDSLSIEDEALNEELKEQLKNLE